MVKLHEKNKTGKTKSVIDSRMGGKLNVKDRRETERKISELGMWRCNIERKLEKLTYENEK